MKNTNNKILSHRLALNQLRHIWRFCPVQTYRVRLRFQYVYSLVLVLLKYLSVPWIERSLLAMSAGGYKQPDNSTARLSISIWGARIFQEL